MNKEQFIKEVNDKRKTGAWYQFIGQVEGKEIRIKGYKTWLQIFTIDGIDNAGPMEIPVKQFNGLLSRV